MQTGYSDYRENELFQPIASANAGSASRLQSSASNPAWLRSSLERATRVKKKWYISLIVFSSVQVIAAVLSFIAFFGYQSEGGAPNVGKTREQVQSWLDTSPSRQSLNAEIMGYDTRERELVPAVYYLQVWVLALGILSLSAGAVIFGMASHYRRLIPLQPTAPPDGGPATPVANSGAGEGPPSVS